MARGIETLVCISAILRSSTCNCLQDGFEVRGRNVWIVPYAVIEDCLVSLLSQVATATGIAHNHSQYVLLFQPLTMFSESSNATLNPTHRPH